MEFNGPKFCLSGENVEFRLVYQKKFKSISFSVLNPLDKELVPIVKNSDNSSIRFVSFPTSNIGIYKISVVKSNTKQTLITKTCFAYNLEKEKLHAELIHWSLDKIEIIMEMKMHRPIIKQITAQAHLLSAISNSTNPNVVIKCNSMILSDQICKFYFIPPQFGSYEIRFFCNNSSTPGPRPQVHVINTTKWKLIHSFTTDKCLTSLKKRASFIFELGGSPSEFLKAWVKCPDKTNINMLLYGEEKHNKIGQLRCDFTPTIIGKHSLTACYQDVMFDKCPLEFNVYDGKIVDIVSIDPDINSDTKPRVGETLTITYKCLNPDSDNLKVIVIASEDSGIYSDIPIQRIGTNNEGIVKFLIKLQFPGKYLIESFYNKDKINSFDINVLNPMEISEQDESESSTTIQSEEDMKRSPTEEASKSILLSNAYENQCLNNNTIPIITGDGLNEAEVDKCAIFIVDPRGERGKLTVDVIGPKSLAKCLIKPESAHGRYEVEYYPKEIGLYQIKILWNEKPLPGSPFKVEATDPRAIQCISHPDIFNKTILVSTNRKTKIDFSYSLAGKGKLSASVNKNNENKNIKSWITVTKMIWTFWIESSDICAFHIDVFWNNIMLGQIKVETENDNSIPDISDDPKSQIVLQGSGLKSAWVGEMAHFIVDTFNVGEGELELSLCGTKLEMGNIPIIVEEQSNGTYHCKYISSAPGDYLLHISWGSIIAKGSPFPIKIWSKDPSQDVECNGDGLKHGLVGEISIVDIDINNAVVNQLKDVTEFTPLISVTFLDPNKNIVPSELSQMSTTCYRVNFIPLISGRHQINILFGNTHVPGSPFSPFYTNKESLDKILIYGPGLKSGCLPDFESYFTVDTTHAGIGKLRVQVKGPKESFRVEIQRNPTNSRLINCSYNPTEIGEYTISISWSGCPIKGSPFKILLD